MATVYEQTTKDYERLRTLRQEFIDKRIHSPFGIRSDLTFRARFKYLNLEYKQLKAPFFCIELFAVNFSSLLPVKIVFPTTMCEKRARKIKKGSHITRLREARRLQRIQRMTPSPAAEDPSTGQLPQSILVVDKTMQSKVILELAWKTVALMHKNKLIQQKILDLQKETSEFVASILNSPENRQRYIDYFKTRATDDIPVPQDYGCSPLSPESYSTISSPYTPLSPSSSSVSEPMSPQWEEETQNLTIKTENVFFKTEPDI